MHYHLNHRFNEGVQGLATLRTAEEGRRELTLLEMVVTRMGWEKRNDFVQSEADANPFLSLSFTWGTDLIAFSLWSCNCEDGERLLRQGALKA